MVFCEIVVEFIDMIFVDDLNFVFFVVEYLFVNVRVVRNYDDVVFEFF